MWPLLVSLYSAVTDWTCKKNVSLNFFFPFMKKCNCTSSSKHVCVDSWWKTRALFFCVQCLYILMWCSNCPSHSLQVQLSQQLKGAIDTSHFLHYSVSILTPEGNQKNWLLKKKKIELCRVSIFQYVTVNHPSHLFKEISRHICPQNSCCHCCLPFLKAADGMNSSHVVFLSWLKPEMILFFDKLSHSARGVWKCDDYSGVFHFTGVTVNNPSGCELPFFLVTCLLSSWQ